MVMTDLYYRYMAGTRTLQDRSRSYAGQQFDSGATRMNFSYDPINYIEMYGWQPFLVFNVIGPDGNPMVYGRNSTPRFDGYTFDIPWELTSRVKTARIEFQLWLVSPNVTVDDETQVPHLDSTDYELSSVAGIALKNSIKARRCDPCGPVNPGTEPNLMGLMDIFMSHGILTPVKAEKDPETGRLTLTFHTYYGENDQTVTLDVPMLGGDGTVEPSFLPIIRSWFDDKGDFLPTQENLASAALVYAALSEKSDKVMPAVVWDANANYQAGALVLDGAGMLYRATSSSKGIQPSAEGSPWVRVLDESDVPSVPEPGSGEEPSDDAILDYGYIKTLLAQKLDVANVISEWSDTASTSMVPSEALVWEGLRAVREHASSLVSDEWRAPLPIGIAPSQRLVKEALDAKTDVSMAIPEWSPDVEYGYQSTVVYEGKLYISNAGGNLDKPPASEDLWWTPIASGGGGSGTVASDNVFVAIVGDGTSTSFTIEHDLATEYVTVSLRYSDERRFVRTTAYVVDDSHVKVTFRHPPAKDGIVVLIASYLASKDAITTTIGDGASTSFTIEHGWGTYNVFSQLRMVTTGLLVEADVTAVDPSHVRIDFAMPPESDSIAVCLAPCIPQGGADRYVHTQTTPSDEWLINHGLNRFVAVYTASLDGEEMNGWVKQDMTTLDSVTIRFSEPVTGIAYLR